ncbi:MAG: serine/threonine-protein kinase, partial [Polyangiales bacterium]
MSPPSTTRHRLILELGRGGMGTVYLAVTDGPAGFSRLKVVKHLREELAADPEFLGLFLEEARLSARLRHPNIVQANEVGFDGRRYFIEMEYLEGQTLAAIQRKTWPTGGLPLDCSLVIFAQMLAGLHYAHRLVDDFGNVLHIVHRDVSPQNVLVTFDGVVKVLDFGIAKAVDSAMRTRTGVVRGKPTYLAPERIRRREVTARVDVFAAGVMLLEELGRARVWPRASDAEILQRLEAGEVPSVQAIAPHAPPELARICERAIAPDPNDRYATAEDLQIAIEEYLEAHGGGATSRRIGAEIGERFAGERATLRREIEEQLRAVGAASRRSIEVPVAGYSTAGASSPSASGVRANDSAESVPRAEPAAQGRAREAETRDELRGAGPRAPREASAASTS